MSYDAVDTMLEPRIQQQFFDSADLKYQTAETLSRPVAEAATALFGAITAGGTVMVCGLGGAQALAAHATGLLVGGFERERPPLAAVDLSAAPGGPLRALQALGHPGDALLLLVDGAGLPAAGDDAAACIALAREKDVTVVLVAGPSGAALAEGLAETDVAVAVPHERGARVAELQLLMLHALADAIDLQLLGEPER